MRVLRIAALLSVAAGVSLLLYAGYLIWDPLAAQRQHALSVQLQREWQRSVVPVDPDAARGPHLAGERQVAGSPAAPGNPVTRLHLVTGRPFAFIRIPRFGRSWRFTIVQGTSLAQLATGPGHVPGTQLPGQRGNFAVAAHDITAGNPFLHLRDLRRGNLVVVTTRYAVYRYRVLTNRVVHYTDVGVLFPVPGHQGAVPGKKLITLITCTPVTLAFTPYRIVVTGVLDGVTAR